MVIEGKTYVRSEREKDREKLKKKILKVFKGEDSPTRPLYMAARKKYRDIHSDNFLFRRLPEAYNRHWREPIQENKILMVELNGRHLSDNFLYLKAYLEHYYDFEIHIHYLQKLLLNRAEYAKRCEKMLADMATSKYVFICEANEAISAITKRPETKVIQLWHGCGAFKRFGRSTEKLIFGPPSETMNKHPQYRNYELACVSSREVVWAYEEAMELEGTGIVQPVGLSRTDIYYNKAAKSRARRRLYREFPAAVGKKIILYAPTFRGRVGSAQPADALDIQAMADALSDDYCLIIKQHPHVKKKTAIPEELNAAGEGSFVLDVSKNPKILIDDLLFASDICISDYSSLIFEYSLFSRPMIFFAYDLEDYSDWRGFYYDYDELTPGPVVRTTEEIIDYIEHIPERFNREEVIAFREKFMGACDGHATERILNRAFGREVLEKYRLKKDKE